ncbi:MAG TPA: GGDEF domain-containing protein [Actinomycetales bacterium]|nr:GGDEF domain-containing protein [Actinomycetales bacterium]
MWWRWYLVGAGLVSLTNIALPGGVLRDALYSLVGLSSVVAMFVGLHLNRPVRRSPWLWMMGGLTLWVGGDTLWSVFEYLLHIDPFPSVADVLYLAGYPMIGVGVTLLIRARRSGDDWGGVIDSSIVTVGLGLVSWVFLMRPTVLDSGDPLLARLIGLAYPLFDVLLLGMLARLVFAPGARTAAYRLLATGVVLTLVADGTFDIVTLVSTSEANALDALWLLGYAFWGATALHPSMRQLSEPAPQRDLPFTRRRLLALAAASLTSPGTLAVQLVLGVSLDGWAVVISSVVLFLLVVARMGGLLSRLQHQATQLAALARTDGLTGLPNRRTGDAELSRSCQRALADGHVLSVAMLDLDHFKVFNDTYGHQAGDRLLVEAAHAWVSGLSDTDVLARYGGEEFMVIMPGRDAHEALALVDALRALTPAGQTFSGGVATWDGTEPSAEALHRADVAMYVAKRAGRDRVVSAEHDRRLAEPVGAGD